MEERLMVKRDDGRETDSGRERMEQRQNLEGTAWCGQHVK